MNDKLKKKKKQIRSSKHKYRHSTYLKETKQVKEQILIFKI
jgi:hypothetical protein